MRRVLPLLLACMAGSAAAQAPPPIVREIGVDERLGQPLPTSLAFRSAAGPVRLADLLGGDRPLLLVLGYYRCPMLCGLLFQRVTYALGKLGWTPGREYRVATVSFDPDDTPVDAAAKQENALRALGWTNEPARWPFLTADAATIAELTQGLGLRYRRDPSTGQFAHPAVVFVLTPAGIISRYLYGLDYGPRDVKLALLEASAGRTGSTLDKVLLACYRWDPTTRRYGFVVTAAIQIGGLVFFLLLAGLLGWLWVRERRRGRG